MSSILRVFDHNCRPLCEINAPTTPRQWILNDVGRAEFSLSTSDNNCTEVNLQYGNLVYIEHLPTLTAAGVVNGKLPPWVGIILPPRTWDYGVVHCVAYSAEAILSFRAMPFVKISGSPHDMFVRLIELTNQAADNIPINLGIIENSAGTYSDDLRLSAYEHIKTLVSNSQMAWDITGQVAQNGNLLLSANLYARKGAATGYTLNNTNTELGSPLLSEQGNPSNVVIGHSQAATPQERVVATGTNSGAVGDYGPLQANMSFQGLHDVSAVRQAAQARADARGRPVKIITRTALDIGALFSYINTGNTVTVKETAAGFAPGGGLGFEAQAQILSVSYNDLSNRCPLNLEIV